MTLRERILRALAGIRPAGIVHGVSAGARFGAQLEAGGAIGLPMLMSSLYRFECFDKSGRLKWVEEVPNIVVTAGLNDILDKYFKGSGYTAAHYVGLVDNAGFSAYAAGDTMGSHGGWAESTAYSNANRPTFTPGTVSGGSVDNSAAKAAFTINATATIKGAFLTTNNTKGGTTGTLYGEASFASNRAVESGDTLNVTVTCTAAP